MNNHETYGPALPCPYCGHDDQTNPLAKIGADMIEWVCNRCGLTWNVPIEKEIEHADPA